MSDEYLPVRGVKPGQRPAEGGRAFAGNRRLLRLRCLRRVEQAVPVATVADRGAVPVDGEVPGRGDSEGQPRRRVEPVGRDEHAGQSLLCNILGSVAAAPSGQRRPRGCPPQLDGLGSIDNGAHLLPAAGCPGQARARGLTGRPGTSARSCAHAASSRRVQERGAGADAPALGGGRLRQLRT